MTAVQKLDKIDYPAFETEKQAVRSLKEKANQDLEETWKLLGWSKLPESLKNLIQADVEAYKEELAGRYATIDPHVIARRRSVFYWVSNYREGICSLETAQQALK